MKACPLCGTLNNDNSIFCISCGNKIEEKILFCKYCGSKILSTNKFCKSCGNEIGETPPISQQRDISGKSQIPPIKKKRNKKLIIILSVVGSALVALIVTLVIVFSMSPAITKPYVNRFATDYSLSQDQKSLIKEWGHPDGFLLAIDLNAEERVESWYYYGIGSELIFINGKFMDGEDLTVYDKSKTKDEFMVYPYEFTNKVTRDDIIKVLGTPNTEDTYQNGQLTVMNYGTQLVIFLIDKKVIGATLFNSEPDKI